VAEDEAKGSIWEKIRNHRLVSSIIGVGLAVIGLAKFTDSLDHLHGFVERTGLIGAPKSLSVSRPTTLREFFKADFENLFKVTQERTLKIDDDTTVVIVEQLYADFDARTCFLGFLIPSTPNTVSICRYLAEHYEDALALKNSAAVQSHLPDEKPVELKDLQFSRRIFIYHEQPIFSSDADDLFALFKAKDLYPQFRGPDYALRRAHQGG
jgi:hypothetical protein